MRRSTLRRTCLAVTLLLAACGQRPAPSPSAAPAPASGDAGPAGPGGPPRPGNYDALLERSAAAPQARLAVAADAGGRLAPTQYAERLGVPSILWARRDGVGGPATEAPEAPALAARNHLRAEAAALGLEPADADAAELTRLHDTGEGAIIATFVQRPGGVEVFREEASVVLDRLARPVAISGALSRAAATARPGAASRLGAAAASAVALADLTGEVWLPEELTARGAQGPFTLLGHDPARAAAHAGLPHRPVRAKRVWFRLPEGLEPAWYVEVGLVRGGDPRAWDYGMVVSADDGRLLFRKDQVQDAAFTYKVWADAATLLPAPGPDGTAALPHPTGTPDGFQPPLLPQSLVTLQNYPFSRNDPWLAANATATTGNNVDAYADLAAPDGFGAGDLRGATSSAGTFSYAYDFALAPGATAAQRQAAIAQLFYDVNFFHDWYYDAGFNEPSGNAQTSNLGRGGVQGDPVLAEAQDSSGTNNANMSTPADGGSPRMQMYLWNNSDLARLVVGAPAPAGVTPGNYAVGTSSPNGSQSYDLTGPLVLATTSGTTDVDDACAAITNAAAVSGKIALVNRGTCTFAVKAKNAQNAGARGVIIRNVLAVSTFGNISLADATVTIPVQLVTLATGSALGAGLANGTVTVTQQLVPGLMRDGTIDNLIVAHEWGHYISNRLVHNAAGLTNQQGGGLGEGFGDTHGLLLGVRAEDAAVAANAGWSGVFPSATFVLGGLDGLGNPDQGYYFGIRRVPYSTDLTKDPLTFKHIANGNPLPATSLGVTVAYSFGTDGTNNAEVHNAGEVWATMLWECYAALLRDPRYGFDQAQARWKGYLVAAYKLVPAAPTFLEARDALLAVAAASDASDLGRFREAFAKRGAGVGAVAPDRASTTNSPLTESFASGVPAAPTGLRLVTAGPTSLTVAWTDAATDETSFAVQLRPATGGAFVDAATPASQTPGAATGANQATLSGLAAGSCWDVQVLAASASGRSLPGSGAPLRACAISAARLYWRNGASGQVYQWQVDGTGLLAATALPVVTLDWTIAGQGDLDGDGQRDLVWRNGTSGQAYAWLMSGASVATAAPIGTVPVAWTIAGIGNTDALGGADLLWRNASTGQDYLWLMSGAAQVGGGFLGSVAAPWTIAGVGDLDGDGKADVVWSNATTRQLYLWTLSGLTQTGGGFLPTLASPWQVAGVGDVDGDGKADLVFWNPVTGQAAAWLMSGTTQLGGAITETRGTTWRLATLADVDGDGKADLVWQEDATGRVEASLMTGASVKRVLVLPTVVGPWRIQP